MIFELKTVVWDITSVRNFPVVSSVRSSAGTPSRELTEREALQLCWTLAAAGAEEVVFAGGGLFMRKDWEAVVRCLTENGISVSVETDGSSVTEPLADRISALGIRDCLVFLGGTEKTHDFLYGQGTYTPAVRAFEILSAYPVRSGAVTVVGRHNIVELPDIYGLLADKDAGLWCLKLEHDVKSLRRNRHLMISPPQLDDVIEHMYRSARRKRPLIVPGCGVGYYNAKETLCRTKAAQSSVPVPWRGCRAGKDLLGILPDGSVTGCVCMNGSGHIEGNVRTDCLEDIWNDKDRFLWNRKTRKSDLTGLCGRCIYGDICLGGCPAVRLAVNGTIYTDNPYCSYNTAMKECLNEIDRISDTGVLAELGQYFTEKRNPQIAEMVFSRSLERSPGDIYARVMRAYHRFHLGNYAASLLDSESVLEVLPDDIYALKGKGMCLCRLGRVEEGLAVLRDAVNRTPPFYHEPYTDFIGILSELGRYSEALSVYKEAETKCPGFNTSHYIEESLYEKFP